MNARNWHEADQQALQDIKRLRALVASAEVVAARLDRLEGSDEGQGRLTEELVESCGTLRTILRAE